MISPAQKMKMEVEKHVAYWMTEFELDKWQVSGVLFDIAMDRLMIIDAHDDEEEDDDDEM